MKLTFGQWIKLGFGGIGWFNKHHAVVDDVIEFREKHRDAIDDAIKLYRSVVPSGAAPVKDGVSHVEVIEKIRNGELTESEKAQFDRASQLSG